MKPTAAFCSECKSVSTCDGGIHASCDRRQALDVSLLLPIQARPARTHPAVTSWLAWLNVHGNVVIQAYNTIRRSTTGTLARIAVASLPVIHAANPCSWMIPACNLASINLMKCRKDDGALMSSVSKIACRIFYIAQEILVDHASYPTRKIAENSPSIAHLVGVTPTGSLLMYYSACHMIRMLPWWVVLDRLVAWCWNLTSVELAASVGPFFGYEANRDPISMSCKCTAMLSKTSIPSAQITCKMLPVSCGMKSWFNGRRVCFRNAKATVLCSNWHDQLLMGRDKLHRTRYCLCQVQATGCGAGC